MLTTLEPCENGDMLLNIPPELIAQGLFLEDDKVDITAKPGCLTIKNLSCIQMRVSRFRRNLNSITRNIVNDRHPLNRVLVHGRHCSFWVIPHDKAKQRAYFQNEESSPAVNVANIMNIHLAEP